MMINMMMTLIVFMMLRLVVMVLMVISGPVQVVSGEELTENIPLVLMQPLSPLVVIPDKEDFIQSKELEVREKPDKKKCIFLETPDVARTLVYKELLIMKVLTKDIIPKKK